MIASHHPIISFISSPFFLSPCPLFPAPSCLLALNNPPPPGVGGADGRAICDCVREAGLLASHHVVPLSRSSLVRYCRPHAMMSSPPPRHRADTAPVYHHASVLASCVCPFLIPCPHRFPPCLLRSVIVSPMSSSPFHPSRPLLPHRLGVIISSSHLRVMFAPASRPALLVEERGGDTGWLRAADCSDVIALLLAYPMPFPRLGRFGSHPSHPRRLVRFASMHVPTEVRSAAVRMPCGRLCLLPRLSVSIVFKMFSCQSFKILRLFGIARLGEYWGRYCPIASPSHLRFASAVSG